VTDVNRCFEFERLVRFGSDQHFGVDFFVIEEWQRSQLTGQKVQITKGGIIAFFTTHRLDKFACAFAISVNIVHLMFQWIITP